eukprot:6319655-Prymnesium_polylepis.1
MNPPLLTKTATVHAARKRKSPPAHHGTSRERAPYHPLEAYTDRSQNVSTEVHFLHSKHTRRTPPRGRGSETVPSA